MAADQACPPDGIKKRPRTLIAALPRKRKEFLDRELARNPQLLDHEPRFFDDLAVLTEDYYPLTEEALWYTRVSRIVSTQHTRSFLGQPLQNLVT